MAGILSFAWLCDLGLGPALTQRIAVANAEGDEQSQSRLLSTGLAVVTGVLSLLWLIGWAVHSMPSMVITPSFPGISIDHAILIAGIGSAQLLASPFLRAQAGYQELHIYNLFGVVGNCIAGAALIAAARWHPSAIIFLLAVYGTSAATQAASALGFLARRRYLLSGIFRPVYSLVAPLLRDGICFALPQVIVPMLLREGPKFMLFQKGLVIETARYGVLVQIMTLASGVIVMFTQPLFPALADAHSRGDLEWTKRTYKKGLQGVAGFSAIFVIVLVLIGPRLLSIYSGNKFSFDRSTLFSFGVCSSLIFWNHLGQIFFQSSGRLGLFVRLCLIEAGVFLALMMLRAPRSALEAFAFVSAALAPTAIVWTIMNKGSAPLPSAQPVARHHQAIAI